MPAPFVYVVDDDASVRRALKRLITSVDMPVRVFGSMSEFIQSGVQTESGCLILDVHMPGGTGFELVEHLDSIGSTLPVILITGHDSDDTRKKAKHCRCFAYLVKPFDDEILLEAINGACKTLASW